MSSISFFVGPGKYQLHLVWHHESQHHCRSYWTNAIFHFQGTKRSSAAKVFCGGTYSPMFESMTLHMGAHVDSEVPMVTTSIARSSWLGLVEVLIRVGLCKCACVYVSVSSCTVFHKKNHFQISCVHKASIYLKRSMYYFRYLKLYVILGFFSRCIELAMYLDIHYS